MQSSKKIEFGKVVCLEKPVLEKKIPFISQEKFRIYFIWSLGTCIEIYRITVKERKMRFKVFA